MAKCPHTGLTIPECSCSGCLDEQIRRVMPVLLERSATVAADEQPARSAAREV